MRLRLISTLALLVGCGGGGSSSAVDASLSDADDVDASDAAPEADASVDDVTPVEAGTIGCGANTCALPGQVCCAELDGGTCFDRDAAPCAPVECDEPGDCPGGTQCCYEFNAGCGVAAQCKPACNATDTAPACQTIADCPACVRLQCGALSLRTCGTDGICCK